VSLRIATELDSIDLATYSCAGCGGRAHILRGAHKKANEVLVKHSPECELWAIIEAEFPKLAETIAGKRSSVP
jgi:hypothetical protein